MIPQLGRDINSDRPDGWATALAHGGRLVIKRRERARKALSSEPDGATRQASDYG